MMATKTKAKAKPRAKTTQPELMFEEGQWWIVQGTKRIDAGRNERYARRMMEEITK
jgi:hypothetical protein